MLAHPRGRGAHDPLQPRKSLCFPGATWSTAGRTSAVLTPDIPALSGVPQLVTVTAATSHVLTTHQVLLRAGHRSHFPEALQPGLAESGWKLGFGDTRPGLSTLVPGCLPWLGRPGTRPSKPTPWTHCPEAMREAAPTDPWGTHGDPRLWPPTGAPVPDPGPQGLPAAQPGLQSRMASFALSA